MRFVTLIAITAAMLVGAFAIIQTSEATPRPVTPSVRDMLQQLPQPARYTLAAHSHHYRHMMGHNYQRTRSGLKLMYMAVTDPMCEGCGGNHPNLYGNCDKCQDGTLAACWGPTTYGTGLVSCICHCGYLDRCIWIRW